MITVHTSRTDSWPT